MNRNEYLTKFLGQYPDSRTLSDGIEALKEEYYDNKTSLTLPELKAIVDGAEYHRKLMFALELKSKNVELTPFWQKFSSERIALEQANIFARATARPDDPNDRRRIFIQRLKDLGFTDLANGPLIDILSPD